MRRPGIGILLASILLLAACSGGGNKSTITKKMNPDEVVRNKRARVDSLFRDPQRSPLPSLTAIDTFKGLHYYPIDTAYRVQAVIERTPNAEPFKMAVSGENPDIYVKYGNLHFRLFGKEMTLAAYKNLRLADKPKYKDYLFVPFRDSTSNITTYGGGRYLDLEASDNDTVMLDFNLAYNPYCAYNHDYSCPIPPDENKLPVAIKAGEKKYTE